jgi:hypothetical protein
LLLDEQCIDGNITFQHELHLQQTPSLLCPKPYKHQKTIKLNLNTPWMKKIIKKQQN